MKRVLKRVLVGRCGVDSGQIMIADPCYLIGDDFADKDYKAALRDTLWQLNNAIDIVAVEL